MNLPFPWPAAPLLLLMAASAMHPSAGADLLSGSFGPSGFALKSADGDDEIRLRGNLSVDRRSFTDSYTPATADTWLIRKLRPTLEGTLGGRYDFRFMPDFGQGKTLIQDAWADVRAQPWLVFTFGKFKAPVGLERLQLEQFNRFIEASLTADLLPYRDLGFQVGGNFGNGVLTYAVGQFDGAADGGSTDSNSTPDANTTGHFTWAGRIFGRPFLHDGLQPLQGLGLGLAATSVNWAGVTAASGTTSLLASYKTPGQQSMSIFRGNTATGTAFSNATIAAGIERRLVPQFYYSYRFASLMGEYVDEEQQVRRALSTLSQRSATLHHTAWQLQAAVFLTGENEAYDAATPRREFGSGGGPGAWEWVVRYHQLRLDEAAFAGGTASFADSATSPRAARAVGTGINWYLDRNFKIQLDYEVTRFQGGASSGNRPDERVLTSQFALIF